MDVAGLAKRLGVKIPGMEGSTVDKMLALVDFETKSIDAMSASLKNSIQGMSKAMGISKEWKVPGDYTAALGEIQTKGADDFQKLSPENKELFQKSAASFLGAGYAARKLVDSTQEVFETAMSLPKKLGAKDAVDAPKVLPKAEQLQKSATELKDSLPALLGAPQLGAALTKICGANPADIAAMAKEANNQLAKAGVKGTFVIDDAKGGAGKS